METFYQEIEKALDVLNCGLLARDAAGGLVYANDRIQAWLGYSYAELKALPPRALAPTEIGDVVDEEIAAMRAGDLRSRLTVARRKDGNRRRPRCATGGPGRARAARRGW